MAILNKIGKEMKNLSDKASEMVEVSKVSTKINAEKNVIASVKGQLGEIIYNRYLDGGITDAEMIELCDQIKASQEMIAKYEEDINKIRSASAEPEVTKRFCRNCGAEVAEDTKFCPDCGTKIAAEEVMAEAAPAEPDVPAAKKHCPGCGSELADQIRFCPNCGYHFEENEESQS